MTPIALLLDRCGLSLREAAYYLDVRRDTVASWSSGRNPTPPGVIDELRALYARIERAADEALATINYRRGSHAEAAIALPLAADDNDARERGWPCVGAHAAMLGIVVARCERQVTITTRPRPG